MSPRDDFPSAGSVSPKADSDRQSGIRIGIRMAITWLHDRAMTMNDPSAQAILNVAASDLGSDLKNTLGGSLTAAPAPVLVIESDQKENSTRMEGSESNDGSNAEFNFSNHLGRQRLWSSITFGPGARSKMCVDHIRKELIEIEADPTDLTEWIDVVILALDGAWRTGAMPNEIIAALVAKQSKNEKRVWPDWRTADPNKAIEHDRT